MKQPSNRKLSAEETMAAEYFKSVGLLVTPHPEGRAKTPDFLVESKSGHAFWVEVKSPDPVPEDRGATWDELNQRLASIIRTAAKQFEAVNSSGVAANVLCLVARDFALTSAGDLLVAITGLLHTPDRELIDVQPNFRGRQLRRKLLKLDLIMLLSEHNRRPQFIYIQRDNEHHRKMLMRLLPRNVCRFLPLKESSDATRRSCFQSSLQVEPSKTRVCQGCKNG